MEQKKQFYYGIIGDIIDSKKIEDRTSVQNKFKETLAEINNHYKNDIAANFLCTLGDEFQGLLYNSEHLLEIIKEIQVKMYPVELRFGIGYGVISTEIIREFAISADGPAYYSARISITNLRIFEKKNSKKAPHINLETYKIKNANESILQNIITSRDTINLLFSYLNLIEQGWNEKQRQTVWISEEENKTQLQLAKDLSTTQPTIQRRLSSGNYQLYKDTKQMIKSQLKQFESYVKEYNNQEGNN